MVITPAERQKLYAERQQNGLIVLPVVVVELDVIDHLQAQGFLETDMPSRAQLAEALSKWLYREMTRHNKARWNSVSAFTG
jgi:hypothetical protein